MSVPILFPWNTLFSDAVPNPEISMPMPWSPETRLSSDRGVLDGPEIESRLPVPQRRGPGGVGPDLVVRDRVDRRTLRARLRCRSRPLRLPETRLFVIVVVITWLAAHRSCSRFPGPPARCPGRCCRSRPCRYSSPRP